MPQPYAVRRGPGGAGANLTPADAPTPAFISPLTRRGARDPWIVRIPRCAERADHELRTAAWGTGELGNWRTGERRAAWSSPARQFPHCSSEPRRPQDEGGQRCISRQKIKNAGVGLGAQTVDKADGHGTDSRRESWAHPHLTLTNSSLMPSQTRRVRLVAQARKPRHDLSSTCQDSTQARRNRAGEFPNHIA